MTDSPPETLTASNCANPQFQGGISGLAPHHHPTRRPVRRRWAPVPGAAAVVVGAVRPALAGAARPPHREAVLRGPRAAPRAKAPAFDLGPRRFVINCIGCPTTTAVGAAAVGSTKSGTQAVGGGSTSSHRTRRCTAGPATIGPAPPWPWLVLVLLLLIPVAWLTVSIGRRRRTGGAAAGRSPSTTPPSSAPVDEVINEEWGCFLRSVFYQFVTRALWRERDRCHQILTPDTPCSPGSSWK